MPGGWRSRCTALIAGGAIAAAGGLTAAAPALAHASRRGSPPPPARFHVGAAVVNIDPGVTTYSGGFGASPPIPPGRVVGSPLSVRALYIRVAGRAVAVEVVDSQGEFAAYQEGARYGIGYARRRAAAIIDARHAGPRMTAADIIVQATHSHSAPTLEGLWGPVPPPYLREVTDAETTALVEAAERARPARLAFGTADASALDDTAVAQYDGYAGWAGDPLLTVLRAVSPTTGRTIATFVTVPAHPDIVCGQCHRMLTADYPGVVRQALQRQLGGVALVGAGTLGREETPVQATGLADMRLLARQATDLADAALGRARWLRSDRLAASQRFVRIPGTNAALLSLNAAYRLPPSGRQRIEQVTGEYPIDRADVPPYLAGSVVGTYLTALRIGDLAYVSAPGEPFPEVREAIAAATPGATVVALSKAQDDLGYFYPAWVTPFTEVFPSDGLTNSVAPEAGNQVIDGQVANLAALGFATRAPLAGPGRVHPAQMARPGVQVVGGPFAGDAGRDGRLVVRMVAVYSPPDLPEGTLDYGPPAGVAVEQGTRGPVRWWFGDGTTGTSGYHEFAGRDRRPVVVTHAFPVGRHVVHVRVVSATGQAAAWTFTVRVYPALHPLVGTDRLAGRRVRLTAGLRGGDGLALTYRWLLPAGRIRYARSLVVPAGTRVRLVAVDGTGTVATRTVLAG
jgi:hypothetical protein